MIELKENNFNIGLHEAEVFFKKDNNNLIGYFLLGGCHYLWNNSFFSWLSNYDQNIDGLILLKVSFMDYKDFIFKCEDSDCEFPSSIIFIDDNKNSTDTFFSITGDLDGELYEEVELKFNYEKCIIEFEYTTNEKYNELISTIK